MGIQEWGLRKGKGPRWKSRCIYHEIVKIKKMMLKGVNRGAQVKKTKHHHQVFFERGPVCEFAGSFTVGCLGISCELGRKCSTLSQQKQTRERAVVGTGGKEREREIRREKKRVIYIGCYV